MDLLWRRNKRDNSDEIYDINKQEMNTLESQGKRKQIMKKTVIDYK